MDIKLVSGWLKEEKFQIVFEEILGILDRYDINCMCGERLESKNLTHTEVKSEYWIYAHCNNCEYDYNYEKILRQWWKKSVLDLLTRDIKHVD